MMNNKRVIFLLMTVCGVISHTSPTPELNKAPTAQPLIVVLPRRIDCDVLRESVVNRVSELNNHKYWQTAYLIGGAGLAAAAWYYWPESKSTEVVDEAKPVVKTERTEVKKADGSTEIKITTTEKPKEKIGFWKKTFRGSAKHAVSTFVVVCASALIASGEKTLSKVFYWWKTPNRVALCSVLFTAAYNAFDGYMLRHKEGFLATNTEVIKRYNRVLRALQQYVVELASQTIFLAKKSDVSIEDSVDLLLAQFSRDVDAANKKITEAAEPFEGDAAMCGTLLNLAIDSVGRLEDLYDGFLEDQKEEPEQKHTQLPYSQSSGGGKRRG